MVVDDHEIFREGLRTVLESRPHLQVVAQASTVREATSLLDDTPFDLLVVDLAMPGSTGLSLLREMRRRKRREPVLVLTMHAEADLAAEAFAAGATGFALKSDTRQELLDAVNKVATGERYIAPSLPLPSIEAFLKRRPSKSETPGPLGILSVREREIFGLLVRGYSNDQIAEELCISDKTVDTHRTHIFKKLEVHSLFELLRFAFRNHLVLLGPAED